MKRNYKTTTTTELDYMRVVKIAIGVLLVLGIVLLVSKLAMGEIKLGKEKEEEKVTEINYQEIIAGEVFNRPHDSYYVLFVNSDDNYYDYYKGLIYSYSIKDNSLPFYIVDLTKKINKEYVNEDSENSTIEYVYPSNIDTLKVKSPTIFKISNSKTVDITYGKDNIIDFFK